MTTTATVLCGILAFLAFYQTVLGVVFVRLFFRQGDDTATDERLPKAAILLSLRGADPNLGPNLKRLLQLDYPDYLVKIVVDRKDDPAWAVVHQAIAESKAENIDVKPLGQQPKKCSLKCRALVQMITELDESVEIVAQVDADVAVHSSWLRELVAPFREPRVGATFGNRWYMPREGYWGSLVRYLWNVGSVVPMYLLSMPWAGTFAIRTSVLREAGIVDKWATAAVDDAPTQSVLRAQGMKLKFVPSLMMVNRQEIDLRSNLEFMTRQLFWTRTYHRNWWNIVLHAAVTVAVLAAGLLWAVWGLMMGRWAVAAWAGGGLLGYQLTMALMTLLMEASVRRPIRARGERTDWLSARLLFRLIAALPLTQVLHLLATLAATFKRYVTWSNVTYHVRGRWDVSIFRDRSLDEVCHDSDHDECQPCPSLEPLLETRHER